MVYRYPYPYYYDHYRTHISNGGRVYSSPSGSYARPGGGSSSSGITHGGFGSTGAAHSSGGGE
jgi:hypothetical protein